MLMARYSLLLLFFHITSFFQLLPWTFLWGLVTWPWWLVQGLLVNNELKRDCVAAGCRWALENEGKASMPAMPTFLRKKFELMQQEAATS